MHTRRHRGEPRALPCAMRSFLRSFALLSLLLAAACGDDRPAAPLEVDARPGSRIDAPAADAPPAWGPPACAEVTGTAAVTFTHDDGATLAPARDTLTGVRYTMGLVALATPNAVLASHAGHVLRSDDAGCSWRDLGDAGGDLVLVAAGASAFGYGDNQPLRVRIDGDRIVRLPDHPPGIVGLAVDRRYPRRVRIVDADAQLWESLDGGAAWAPIGVRPITTSRIVYRGAFATDDLDHVVVGASFTGAHVSRDGGATWTTATGLAPGIVPGASSAMNLAFAGADGAIVWATGINLDDGSRHVWRSTDGGVSYTDLVTQPEMTITNGMPIFPHPTNVDVLYATFGTYVQDHGTDLYRYDASTDAVALHQNAFQDVRAIAFLPSDPSWMWLGASRTAPTAAP